MAKPPPRALPPDFRALFESAPGLYLVLTTDFTIVAVSDAYLSATMTRRDEILGRGLFEVFPDNPDDPRATGVANLRASLGRVLAHRRSDAMAVQKYDIRRPLEEGGGFEVRYWSPVNSPVIGAEGRIRYIIHRVEDVTEFVRLKQQGTEQHKLTEELRSRAEVMEAEVYRRAQEIQEANRRLRELQADLERRVQARTTDLQRANQELQRQIAERERTEAALRRSEDQLRQAQKLEAVGRLAGGIAHDFNNLLTVILSYSETLLPQCLDDAMRRELEEIRRAGQRAAELTRQLLAFSRQQVLEPAILDVNVILRELHAMLNRVLGEDVDLELALAPDLGNVKVDRGQLEQVMMNLVVNARDAMPAGGRLTIETANAEVDGSSSARESIGVQAGRYVIMAVRDSGSGMDRALQARAFEPFFTTKERGKGTGLGLSTVFGIVKQSGGGISLQSEPGLGTTFRIYLPRTEGEVQALPAPAPTAKQSGDETILLVEDQDQVRAVASGILRAAGFRVLEASGPHQALALAEPPTTRIDLVLTDVVMPRMNGAQMAERIRALRPQVRVLFMSGYTDDVILATGVLDSGVAFIQKPLMPAALTRKVRQVLAEAPAGQVEEPTPAPRPS